MKRKMVLFLTIFSLVFMGACGPVEEEETNEILPDDIITMDILDDYMFRDDVQYVDLRNHEQLLRSGFIYSFENIPFFDYLDYRAFIRGGTYEFDPSQIINEEQLTRFFDRDKAILLTADGCIRSGYIKDVLNYLGYERVYVIGGFFEYQGEYKVLGDGKYQNGSRFFGNYTDQDTGITYHVSGIYELDRHPIQIYIDMIDSDGNSMRNDGYDESIDYKEQLTLLENAILGYATNFNDLYVSFSDDNPNEFNQIEGYTLGFPYGLLRAIKELSVYE